MIHPCYSKAAFWFGLRKNSYFTAKVYVNANSHNYCIFQAAPHL